MTRGASGLGLGGCGDFRIGRRERLLPRREAEFRERVEVAGKGSEQVRPQGRDEGLRLVLEGSIRLEGSPDGHRSRVIDPDDMPWHRSEDGGDLSSRAGAPIHEEHHAVAEHLRVLELQAPLVARLCEEALSRPEDDRVDHQVKLVDEVALFTRPDALARPLPRPAA